jgi:Na+/H+ antiporter NhaD/arsenite permease-like protein
MVFSHDKHSVEEQLLGRLGDLSGIIFFLMSAMTIVELIDAHNGFNIITKNINQAGKRNLAWTLSLITFFLSAILDNLTTSIIMVLLLRKLINNAKERLFFTGIIIIAANAGGAWSPMGDITSTMLWMGKQVTPKGLLNLFLPSLAAVITPLIIFTSKMKGNVKQPVKTKDIEFPFSKTNQYVVLISGLFILISVPVLKILTGLPPYMGILLGLGILWVITEIIHYDKENEKHEFTVANALRRIDTPSILFFLGILLGIAALQSAGILQHTASWLDSKFINKNVLVTFIGLLSSIVDNVPLVAASQAMYQYPTDHNFWLLLTYCTGTGGSLLLIGSAAGIAAMGMEKISFLWYLKKITFIALTGYLAGIAVYFIQDYFLNL